MGLGRGNTAKSTAAQCDSRTSRLASFPMLNPNPVLEVDSSGKPTYLNGAAKQVIREAGGLGAVMKSIPGGWKPLYSRISKAKSFQWEMQIKDRIFLCQGSAAPGAVRIHSVDISRLKAAEGKLKQSEERYRILVDANPDIIITISLIGRIVSASRAMSRILGYKDSEFIGRNIREFIPREELPDVLRTLAESLRGKQHPGFITHVRKKGGGIVAIEASGAPLFSGARPIGFIGVLRDMTGRKKAEEAQKKASVEMEDLYNNAPCAYHSLDETGKFIRINNTALKWLGYKREELVGKKGILDILPPEERETFKTKFPILKKTGRLTNLEGTIIRKDGTIFPTLMEITTVRDKSGKFLADRATWFDMTEQKKTGETLRESEQKFRNFFESSNDAIFIADGETHKLVDCNKKAEKLIGRPKAQILSMRADELHPKDRVKETMEGFERQAQGKIAIIETEVLARSGKRIPVEVNAAAFAAGEKRYLVGIFRDITERKAAEQQLRESEGRYTKRLEDEVKVRTAELQQALKEKDEYLSTTTHELKTPLVPIKMQTELWLSGAYGTIDEKQRGSLGMVLKSTVRLARLIDDVLFVSKIEGANLKYYLKEVDLGAALRESVGESMEAMSRKRISLTGSIAAGKMMVNGDDMRLKQVFSNLISNAIKFTPEGGSVSVTSKVSGKNALVAITDTGIGMSEEYLSRVFGKFQQADQAITRKFGGTGLGLAICHGIVAQHKGRIWVESSVGKGTTVFVMLPLLQNKGKAEG